LPGMSKMPPQLVHTPRQLDDLALQLAGHYALREQATPRASAETVIDRYASQSPRRV
jgi:hypothetical protein